MPLPFTGNPDDDLLILGTLGIMRSSKWLVQTYKTVEAITTYLVGKFAGLGASIARIAADLVFRAVELGHKWLSSGILPNIQDVPSLSRIPFGETVTVDITVRRKPKLPSPGYDPRKDDTYTTVIVNVSTNDDIQDVIEKVKRELEELRKKGDYYEKLATDTGEPIIESVSMWR